MNQKPVKGPVNMLCVSLNDLVPPLTFFGHERRIVKLNFKQSFKFPSLFHTKLLYISSSCSFSSPGVAFSASSSPATAATEDGDEFDDELGRLLSLVPEEMRRTVEQHPEMRELIEVVLDLGRKPLARFPSGDFVISNDPVRVQDLQVAVSQVGDFTNDNRAGISRTLHRISAIRNRKGEIIGLTCRVGRAIRGSAKLLRDLVQDGNSLLLIGSPGVGKTTIIREAARMLANDCRKRVMIVDTSSEIGGDGDIPHPGIGNARRMQVPDSDMQHKVLIEAVENHMPQVIVIDEIGTKLEAMAASTIAERGIQLVATAHGATIENLVMNPSLDLLVGGVQNVTLGDEEATRRGVQKTVLERKGPPTFSCGVEIISKTELRVHRSLEATVDSVLAGTDYILYPIQLFQLKKKKKQTKKYISCSVTTLPVNVSRCAPDDSFSIILLLAPCRKGRVPNFEIRKINSQGVEEITEKDSSVGVTLNQKHEIAMEDFLRLTTEGADSEPPELPLLTEAESSKQEIPLYLFVYGVAESSVVQGIKELEIETAVELTDNMSEADALLGLQSRLKKNSRIQSVAKSHSIPIYVTKTNSAVQVTKAIQALVTDYEDGILEFGSKDRVKLSEKMDALEEARMAIEQVVIPNRESVELLPRPSKIVSLQAKLIKKYNLQSKRICRGPEMCVRILPSGTSEDTDEEDTAIEFDEFDEFTCATTDSNGSAYSVDRLPLLPD